MDLANTSPSPGQSSELNTLPPMVIKGLSGVHKLATGGTGVGEGVGEVYGLHVVKCVVFGLVEELVADVALVPAPLHLVQVDL